MTIKVGVIRWNALGFTGKLAVFINQFALMLGYMTCAGGVNMAGVADNIDMCQYITGSNLAFVSAPGKLVLFLGIRISFRAGRD